MFQHENNYGITGPVWLVSTSALQFLLKTGGFILRSARPASCYKTFDEKAKTIQISISPVALLHQLIVFPLSPAGKLKWSDWRWAVTIRNTSLPRRRVRSPSSKKNSILSIRSPLSLLSNIRLSTNTYADVYIMHKWTWIFDML